MKTPHCVKDPFVSRAAIRSGCARPATFSFLVLLALFFFGDPASAQADFRRGDANVDGVVDIADVSYLYRWINAMDGVESPPCGDAVDVNDTGTLSGAWLYLLTRLFVETRPWLDPGPYEPGPDPTADSLTCETYAPALPAKLADFALGFECAPPSGEPGETITFQAFATLRTSSNTASRGADGWSLSIGAENLRILSATTAGTAAAMVTDDPPGFATGSWLRTANIVDPEANGGEGVVSAVILFKWRADASLPREGTHRLLALTLEAVVPASPDPAQAARLFFADGKKGPGEPVRNVVTLLGTAQSPALGGWARNLLDCNSNGVPDSTDISSGTSQDCNANAIPDECEVDCNQNGRPDSCDIADGVAADCNANGIPDDCDLASGSAPDCNSNGMPDSCDIATGTSADCNGNDIPDSCDIAGGAAQDCNANGIPDLCEIASGSAPDCNANDIPDGCDIASGLLSDADSDGLPDICGVCREPDPVACEPGGEPVFRLKFRGSCRLTGEPGEIVRTTIACQIETLCYEGTKGGVVSWTIGLTAAGCTLQNVTHEGLLDFPVSVNYAGLIDPSENDGMEGAMYSGGLRDPDGGPPWVHLDPTDSPQDIFTLTLEAKIPEDGTCGRSYLVFRPVHPPKSASGFRPEPRLTYNFDPDSSGNLRTAAPLLEPFTIELCPEASGGLQHPGDGNQDGALDLSDAIWLLGHLFLGTALELPCEGGTASSPGPGDLALADVNGDGRIDLSDPVSVLGFLFLGSKPPVLGKDCVRIPGCPDNDKCPW